MNVGIVVVLVHFLFIATSAADDCDDISGVWNAKGRHMVLHLRQTKEGSLSGKYGFRFTFWKAEEITGVVSNDDNNRTFAINLVSSDGYYVQSWIGQCLVCNGERHLLTTVLTRKGVSYCTNSERLFTNIDQENYEFDRPLEKDDEEEDHLNTPSSGGRRTRAARAPRLCRSRGCGRRASAARPLFRPRDHHDTVLRGLGLDCSRCHPDPSPAPAPPLPSGCSVDGVWYNELGTSVNIIANPDGSLNGSFSTSFSQGDSYDHGIYGRTDPVRSTGLVVLNVFYKDAAVITWVGQCQQCQSTEPKQLKASWLMRTKVQSCAVNFLATRYGNDVFTPHKQEPLN